MTASSTESPVTHHTGLLTDVLVTILAAQVCVPGTAHGGCSTPQVTERTYQTLSKEERRQGIGRFEAGQSRRGSLLNCSYVISGRLSSSLHMPLGVPLWLTGLRPQRCHCCGLDAIPLGAFACPRRRRMAISPCLLYHYLQSGCSGEPHNGAPSGRIPTLASAGSVLTPPPPYTCTRFVLGSTSSQVHAHIHLHVSSQVLLGHVNELVPGVQLQCNSPKPYLLQTGHTCPCRQRGAGGGEGADTTQTRFSFENSICARL